MSETLMDHVVKGYHDPSHPARGKCIVRGVPEQTGACYKPLQHGVDPGDNVAPYAARPQTAGQLWKAANTVVTWQARPRPAGRQKGHGQPRLLLAHARQNFVENAPNASLSRVP